MERLTEIQLESRIHAFLARKTDQVETDDPLADIEQSQRWQHQHRSLRHYSLNRSRIAL